MTTMTDDHACEMLARHRRPTCATTSALALTSPSCPSRLLRALSFPRSLLPVIGGTTMLNFTITPEIEVPRGMLTETAVRAARGQQTHEIAEGGRA